MTDRELVAFKKVRMTMKAAEDVNWKATAESAMQLALERMGQIVRLEREVEDLKRALEAKPET